MTTTLVHIPYSLSIRIFSDGFSLFIYDEGNQLISQKTISDKQLWKPENHDAAIFNEPEIHSRYQKISIEIETGIYTLIPEDFYNENTAPDYLRMQHADIPNKTVILSQKAEKFGVRLIYAFPEHLKTGISAIFPGTPISHHLISILNNTEFHAQEKVFIYIRKQFFDCIVMRKGNILLMNDFKYQSREDVVYHCMNIISQLDMNNEECVFVIYHNNHDNPETALRPYVTHIISRQISTEYENYKRTI